MELDEEDYEALGFGGQRASEELARHVRYKMAMNVLAVKAWRKAHPEKYRALVKKRYWQIKADPIQHAKAKASYVKYNKSLKGKTKRAVSAKKRHTKLKQDPVRYAARLKQQADSAKRRRERANSGKQDTNNKRTTRIE